MRRYFILTMMATGAFVALHFSVCLFLQSPITAEYWMAESIAVKRMIARSLPPPRLVFLGGSSTFFGIDARQVEKEIGVPSLNLGMHAAMRLDDVLSIGEEIAHRGDIFVLPLEDGYYGDQTDWSDWPLRNVLAWDRPYFSRLPLRERIKAVFTAGGGPRLMIEILVEKIGSIAKPSLYADRIQALAPPNVIWARFQSDSLRTDYFAYSAYNLDDRGDMLHNRSWPYSGGGIPPNAPDGVYPSTLLLLRGFVSRMHDRGVRVFFAHTPYLTETAPTRGWQDAETKFSRDIASTGARILDRREELFLPRAYFFGTCYHLNEAGRRVRTENMVVDLRKLGIGRALGK